MIQPFDPTITRAVSLPDWMGLLEKAPRGVTAIDKPFTMEFGFWDGRAQTLLHIDRVRKALADPESSAGLKSLAEKLLTPSGRLEVISRVS